MSKSEQEKVYLEHQAAKLFMRLYEKLTPNKIRHIWHNTPSKPDVSCLINGEKLDLEIAHLYASEKEAMSILGRELSEDTRQSLLEQETKTNMTDRLIAALQRILWQKSSKRYNSKNVWLVIRNSHPEWTADLIVQQLTKLVIPENHPFEEIWLVSDLKGTGLIQLFPDINVLTE